MIHIKVAVPKDALNTLWNKSFNSEKNSAKSDSIKNNTHWMSRFEFQKKITICHGLGSRLNLAPFKKIWRQNSGRVK